MPCILHIETSASTCSVALSHDSTLLADIVSEQPLSHAALLAGYVQEALTIAKEHALQLDAVSVSMGPGSYTGLRIGVSMAKGICYAKHIPLLAVPTLRILAVAMQDAAQGQQLEEEHALTEALWCPMTDARRLEVYTALYDHNLQPLHQPVALTLDSEEWQKYLSTDRLVVLGGSGAEKCGSTYAPPSSIILPHCQPLARYMPAISEELLAAGNTADTAYFEPFYLKDFRTTTPRRNPLSVPPTASGPCTPSQQS